MRSLAHEALWSMNYMYVYTWSFGMVSPWLLMNSLHNNIIYNNYYAKALRQSNCTAQYFCRSIQRISLRYYALTLTSFSSVDRFCHFGPKADMALDISTTSPGLYRHQRLQKQFHLTICTLLSCQVHNATWLERMHGYPRVVLEADSTGLLAWESSFPIFQHKQVK